MSARSDHEDGAARGRPPITVTNPLSGDHSILRQALVGSLVEVVSSNLRHGDADVAVFEVGKGYGPMATAPRDAREWWRLGLAGTGAGDPAGTGRAATYDIDDAKGAIELLAGGSGSERPRTGPERGRADPAPGPRRSGHVPGRPPRDHWRRRRAPPASVVDGWDLRGARVVVAELAVTGLAGGRSSGRLREPRRRATMPSERDLAVVVGRRASPPATWRRDPPHAGSELLRTPPLRRLPRPARSARTTRVSPTGSRSGPRIARSTRRRSTPPIEAITAGLHTQIDGRISLESCLRPRMALLPCAALSHRSHRHLEETRERRRNHRQLRRFDLLFLLLLLAMFVLGFQQGTIRRLLGIGSILFSFLFAASLRGLHRLPGRQLEPVPARVQR